MWPLVPVTFRNTVGPVDGFPGRITADQTGRHATHTGPCFDVRKAVAAAAAAKARRLAIANTTRRSPKRTRRCSMSDALKPSPRMQPSVPRVPCRELNKENIEPRLLPSKSSPPGPRTFPSGGGARVQGCQSIAQPARRKRLLSEASSSFNSSRQCSKLSDRGGNRDGGNNFKVKKGWDNSREPLRVLWTREGNTSTAPPVFLRGLRSL